MTHPNYNWQIWGSSTVSKSLWFHNISRLEDPPNYTSNPSSLKLRTADAFPTLAGEVPSGVGAGGKAAMGSVTSGISESKSVPASS